VKFRCEKLVAEARGVFGNPEEGERPPLETVTRQRMMKAQQAGKTCVHAVVNFTVYELTTKL
jgi:hypothetical protein